MEKKKTSSWIWIWVSSLPLSLSLRMGPSLICLREQEERGGNLAPSPCANEEHFLHPAHTQRELLAHYTLRYILQCTTIPVLFSFPKV